MDRLMADLESGKGTAGKLLKVDLKREYLTR